MKGVQMILIAMGVIAGFILLGVIAWRIYVGRQRAAKNRERALKMVPMMIHLPPSTDDIQGGGRDERDVTNEEVSEAQVMYNIISSTLTKGLKGKVYGQKHLSFEIVAHDGLINYYAVIPLVMVEAVRQAITAAYPTARLEKVEDPNFFSAVSGIEAVSGGELALKDYYYYPIATYEDTKRDASLALINALSNAKKGDGIGIQILIRPTDGSWTKKSLVRVQEIKDGKKSRKAMSAVNKFAVAAGNAVSDIAEALWKTPDEHAKLDSDEKILTNLQQEEIQKIEDKTKYPGFEVLVRIVVSSANKGRSDMLLNTVVSIFSQFDLQNYNGFCYNMNTQSKELVWNYILRNFDQKNNKMVLNSVELASLFHLPSQKSIPTSQVERQATKQVDGPAKLAEDGIILGINEFRGEKKTIRLRDNDRRRHTYAIGSTGSGKSVFLENIAYQDMCDGRGFAFIDPHGDAVEWLLSRVPPERMDDVILFEPGNMERPVGMNMFEFQTEDQKDFIVQEAINMLVSLYDPSNQGIFGARAQHMFRNAALLLMSDPNGGTFIDVPRCFIDPEFVKEKLRYVTDKSVYDYWTKEFPASQKSSDAGEVTTWFVSKWGPFLSNKMMRNILGQPKSGFNIREIMDNKKILLVNLSKGTTGELNAKLLGMIFVMKFQAAAMSRADMPENERQDFCLFVDEFQNFSTESFESILSEARKYRLNLILANQFMTQLTDKIREAILGNVGTIMSGRLGVTDAELMEKAFSPVFTAEDLHKLPNYNWITTVMMFDMPTSPFTLRTLPPMGEGNEELMKRMKEYALSRHGRPRSEVEAEIDERLADKSTKKASAVATEGGESAGVTAKPAAKKSFLDAWLEKRNKLENSAKQRAEQVVAEKQAAPVASAAMAAPAMPSPVAPVVPKAPAMPTPVIKTETEPQEAKPSVPALAPKPKPQTVADRVVAKTEAKNTAADKLLKRSDGSVWAAAAAKNTMAAAEAGEVIPNRAVKIQHEATTASKKAVPQKPITNATKTEKTSQAASRGPKKQDNANGSVESSEDGVVLRWR